jgi:hypothetical protein
MILVFLVAARIRHPNVCNICSSEKIINISLKILSFIHYILWHYVQLLLLNALLIRSSRKRYFTKLQICHKNRKFFLYIYRKTLQYSKRTWLELQTMISFVFFVLLTQSGKYKASSRHLCSSLTGDDVAILHDLQQFDT